MPALAAPAVNIRLAAALTLKRYALADLVVERGRLRPVYAKLQRDWGEKLLDAEGKLGVAGRRVLHLVQFPPEPAEVVDRPRGGARRAGSFC